MTKLKSEDWITNAPKSYDGFGTQHLGFLPYKSRGAEKPFRRVSVPPEALANDWQAIRYQSGGYLAIKASELPEWVELWELAPQIYDYVLLDPTLSEAVMTSQGESVEEAIAKFNSSVWTQGWGADERVLNTYGDYRVYQSTPSRNLTYMGLVRDFLGVKP